MSSLSTYAVAVDGNAQPPQRGASALTVFAAQAQQQLDRAGLRFGACRLQGDAGRDRAEVALFERGLDASTQPLFTIEVRRIENSEATA